MDPVVWAGRILRERAVCLARSSQLTTQKQLACHSSDSTSGDFQLYEDEHGSENSLQTWLPANCLSIFMGRWEDHGRRPWSGVCVQASGLGPSGSCARI